MIKITFEISEDFINEKADLDKLPERLTASNALELFKNTVSFTFIKEAIESGTTEFCVTPDKLDERSMEIYNQFIGDICALAAFSETDNKKE